MNLFGQNQSKSFLRLQGKPGNEAICLMLYPYTDHQIAVLFHHVEIFPLLASVMQPENHTNPYEFLMRHK